MNLPRILLEGADQDPGRPLVWFEGTELGRAEVARAALRVAGWLERAGLDAGDRVGLMLGNRPEFYAAWFGTNLAGHPIVPFNLALRGDDLAYQLAHSGVRVLFAERELLPVLSALPTLPPNLRTTVVLGGTAPGTLTWAEVQAAPEGAVSNACSDDGVMEVIYTSGTTSRPKGVIWKHGAMPHIARALARQVGLGDDDRLMTVLPLFHGNAQLSTAMALTTGGSLLLLPRFTASGFWEVARRGGATEVNLLGPVLAMLHGQAARPDDAENPIRTILSAATPAVLHEAFEQRFGVTVIEAYGLTETGINTVNPVERGRRKLGTIGLAAPYNAVAVLDEDLRPLPAGQPGEICVRPTGEMEKLWRIEYLGDPEATARLWRGGWLHTGDQGVCDAEGFLTFVDRLKDVIRRRGENISSQQVEHVLLAHPAVAEAAVLGVPAAVGEEDVLALVVLRTPASAVDLAAFCRERLAEFKVPSLFKVVGVLPKTPTGRVKKAELKAAGGLRDGAEPVAPVRGTATAAVAQGAA
jgi:crotonobetaine/carnitine-CoA ligase